MMVSTPQAASSAARIGSFTVHAATRSPAEIHGGDGFGLKQRVLRVDATQPSAAQRSRQSSGSLSVSHARQRRHDLERGLDAVAENDDSSGGTSLPFLSGVERHGRAGLALPAGRGLDLDVERDAVRTAVARDRRERGQHLAGVRRRVPAARVEQGHTLPFVEWRNATPSAESFTSISAIR